MARQHHIVVGQSHYLVAQIFNQLLVVATRQVGAAYTALEECVAGDYSLFGRNHIADAALAMARHKAAFNLDAADCQLSTFVYVLRCQVVGTSDIETHYAAIGLGLA